MIVDSCYSGRAIGVTLGVDDQMVRGQLEITGTYILTSAPSNSPAFVRDGEAHTAFTGRMLDLFVSGGPERGDLISLGEMYEHLRARLRADGLPEPQVCGTGSAALLGLVRNRRPGEHPRPSPPANPRAYRVGPLEHIGRLLEEAERTAIGIDSTRERVKALIAVAGALPPREAARCARLADEVERAAAGMVSSYDPEFCDRAESLAGVAVPLAAVDRVRARRLAAEADALERKAADEYSRDDATKRVAQAQVVLDPGNAEQLIKRVVRRTRKRAYGNSRDDVACELAVALAPWHPKAALALIAGVESNYERAAVLTRVAVSHAGTDPDSAEQAAAAIGGSYVEPIAMARVALVLAVRTAPGPSGSRRG